MTEADDLVAFIRARLDEDEQAATNCLGVNERAGMLRGVQPARWEYRGGRVWSAPYSGVGDILRVGHTWENEGRHIALQDPLRVLRGVEAKRQTVALLVRSLPGGCDCEAHGHHDKAKQALLLLASEWTDHPKFRQAWRL